VFAALISQVSSSLTTACDKSYPPRVFPYAAWKSETWKTAARAGLRHIGRMVQQGNVAGASALAKTPGVLKPSVAGSQIRQLGRGSEGMATLVAHPQHGVAVRKMYDPRGISSPAMIARKEEAGRAVAGNENFARFLGSAPTPHQGGTMHFNEYVPSSRAPVATKAQSVTNTGQQAQQALQHAGYEGHDIHSGNMVYDQGTGRHKVVDFLPGREGEFAGLSPDNRLQVTPQGSHLFGDSPNPSTGRGMLGHMLGGAPGVMPQRRLVTPDMGRRPAPPQVAGATNVVRKPRPFAGGTPSPL
jgi:hypothetical protein